VFIRKTRKSYKGRSYDNYVLVESVRTPKGPRQKIVCSPGVRSIVERARRAGAKPGHTAAPQEPADRIIAVDTDRIRVGDAREAGAVYAGHQMWRRLGLDAILADAGLSQRARRLRGAMVLDRLISPLSDHAMSKCIRHTALDDLLGVDFSTRNEDALYRNLDQLHPNCERIETALAERETTLFNLDDTVYSRSLRPKVADHTLLVLAVLAVAFDEAEVLVLDALAAGGFDRTQEHATSCHGRSSDLHFCRQAHPCTARHHPCHYTFRAERLLPLCFRTLGGALWCRQGCESCARGCHRLIDVAVYTFHALVTALAPPAADVSHFCNGRGDRKNRLKELRRDSRADGFCLQRFYGAEAASRFICFLNLGGWRERAAELLARIAAITPATVV
jgi:hypothetical protein